MTNTPTVTVLTQLPLVFWLLVAVCFGGSVLLWWRIVGRQRIARRRGLHRQIALCGRAESPAEQATLDGLRQAPRQARLTLMRSGGGRSALYRVPWLLFLGDAAADVPRLLDAASASAGGADTFRPFWQWHALPSMTAIGVDPQVLQSADVAPPRRLWCQALLALARERPRLPLNGIVVCVGASSLMQAAQATARDVGTADESPAHHLRRLIDQAAEHLHLRLPVYLVVTGLEQLTGYDTLRSALPKEVLAQVIGYRWSGAAGAGAAASARADDRATVAFVSIMARLDALRMALLLQRSEPADRLAIHAFVEQVRALEPGLRRTANVLFGRIKDGRRPQRWRGLYLTGSTPSGADASGAAFTSDLFERFLPADQPLARFDV
jgi:type VI protein secretion system component VasK